MRTQPHPIMVRWIAAAALAIVAVATTAGVSACSSSKSAGSTTCPATGQHMTASDFSTAMKAPGTIVLDVRTPAEYASGHLPAAQNIDIEAQTSHHGSAHSTRTRPLPCTAAAGTGRAPC